MRACGRPARLRLGVLLGVLLAALGCGESVDEGNVDLAGTWTGAVRWQSDAEDQLTLEWPADGTGGPSWHLGGGTVSGIARAESRRPGAVVIQLEERQPCAGTWRLSGILVQANVLEATLTGSDCTRRDEGAVTLVRNPTGD